MSDLDERFARAAEESKKLPKRPDDMTLLKLYSLYKQATTGNATGARPGLSDFVERAKFDAWSKLKGVSKEAAMKDYVDLVERLKAKK
jgi:acyl-CoA-binding protein